MITCTKFESYESPNSALKGTCNFLVEGLDMELRNCMYFEKGPQRWINYPSKKYQTKTGETGYFSFIFFKDKEKHNQFQNECLKALDEKLKFTHNTQTTIPNTQYTKPSMGEPWN